MVIDSIDMYKAEMTLTRRKYHPVALDCQWGQTSKRPGQWGWAERGESLVCLGNLEP